MGIGLGFVALLVTGTFPIVGVDDRRELYETPSPALRRVATATGMILRESAGYLVGEKWGPTVPTHGEFDNLCSDVRYRNQPAPADCSGFLGGEDLFVTALHCVPDASKCADTKIIFDFAYERENVLPAPERSRVFQCRRIVASDVDADWVILQLDRPSGRAPLPVRGQGPAPAGTPLAIVGFPRGIPMKIAAGAAVLPENTHADPRHFFEALLDTFGGNSGSPVVDENTGVVQGILNVAFGELEEGEEPVGGKPCKRLRTITDPAEATPAWVSRAEGFARRLRGR